MNRKVSRAKHKQAIGKFRSGFEQRVDANLRAMDKQLPFEPDIYSFPVRISKGGCLACGSKAVTRQSTYTPDFKLSDNVYIEAKGKFTSGNRTRLRAFSQAHPGITIYLLFQRDNWLTARKLKRYTQWATEHGYKSFVGESPPSAWFN